MCTFRLANMSLERVVDIVHIVSDGKSFPLAVRTHCFMHKFINTTYYTEKQIKDGTSSSFFSYKKLVFERKGQAVRGINNNL